MSPFYVLLFYWSYRRIPRDLIDAGRLEGLGPFAALAAGRRAARPADDVRRRRARVHRHVGELHRPVALHQRPGPRDAAARAALARRARADGLPGAAGRRARGDDPGRRGVRARPAAVPAEHEGGGMARALTGCVAGARALPRRVRRRREAARRAADPLPALRRRGGARRPTASSCAPTRRARRGAARRGARPRGAPGQARHLVRRRRPAGRLPHQLPQLRRLRARATCSTRPATASTPRGFYPQPVDAFTVDGALRCVPQNVSSLVVYYNADRFQEAGRRAARRATGRTTTSCAPRAS